MASKRGRTIELVAASMLFGVATSLSLGQGGPPPVVPKCTCTHANCAGKPAVTAQSCSCCKIPGTPVVWDCKACNINFDCVSPPSPYTMCLEGGV